MILVFFIVIFRNVCSAQVIDLENFWREVEKPNNYGIFTYDVGRSVESFGYPFEKHQVQTEDGYILALHRIPNGKAVKANNEKKPAVLLMHGILGCSTNYMVFGPDRSLAFQLVELGYDVWMGNSRGNIYSRKHKKFSPNTEPTFWDFSFHELGVYDIPAMTEYILTNTSLEKISYIGHSQGTTEFFVALSMKPEYNQKFSTMIALAPVVYMQNVNNLIVQYLAEHLEQIKFLLKAYQINEILPHSPLFTLAGRLLCRDGSPYQELCAGIIFMLEGQDSKELNRSDLPALYEMFPAGCSVKQLLHYGQELRSGHFRQFDYGSSENLDRYKTKTPPDYNLSKIEIPIALFYGKNDKLASKLDVEKLAKQLPKVEKHLIEYEQFNHFDFILAKDVKTMLYFDVINVLNMYNHLPEITTAPTTTESTTTTRVTTITPESTSKTASSSSYLSPNYKFCIIMFTLALLKSM